MSSWAPQSGVTLFSPPSCWTLLSCLRFATPAHLTALHCTHCQCNGRLQKVGNSYAAEPSPALVALTTGQEIVEVPRSAMARVIGKKGRTIAEASIRGSGPGFPSRAASLPGAPNSSSKPGCFVSQWFSTELGDC